MYGIASGIGLEGSSPVLLMPIAAEVEGAGEIARSACESEREWREYSEHIFLSALAA